MTENNNEGFTVDLDKLAEQKLKPKTREFNKLNEANEAAAQARWLGDDKDAQQSDRIVLPAPEAAPPVPPRPREDRRK